MVQKDRIKLGLKLVIGACLIYYVLNSNMVDFNLLKKVWLSPLNLIISFLFMAFSAIACSFRWYLLVRAQGLSMSWKDMFGLTMIGNFFNTFMPGAVGGDLIKAWYVAGHEPKRKTKAIFTVLLDRLIGLSVIIFFAAATLLIYFKWLRGNSQLQWLGVAVWGFTGCAILIGILFFMSTRWRSNLLERVVGWLNRFRPIAKIMEATVLYRDHLPAVSFAFLLSASSIFGMIILWGIQGNFLGISIEWSYYFFLVPLGLTVSAVPLLPGGIGVGQVAFYTLFQFIGHPNPEQGGALCTLIQLYTILWNCTGAFFYLKIKRKPIRGVRTEGAEVFSG